MNAYSSFIQNTIELEITQMFINSSVNKQIVKYPHNDILFRKKIRINRMDKSQNNYAERKNPRQKCTV